MGHHVQADVLAELAFDPNVDSGDIRVAADGGAVSLRGTVGSVRCTRHAQCAARRIQGVMSVRSYLRVRPLVTGSGDDADVRTAVLQALLLDVTIPATIHADVSRGVVHLVGTATWHCEREEAEHVCTAVPGVRGIENEIAILPASASDDMERLIMLAYRRSARLARQSLSVDAIASGIVIVSGMVTSWSERDEAVAAAWSASGVARVEDRILIAT